MDTMLTVPAPGILGNDIGFSNFYQGLTRFPEHGQLESIDATGAFTYVPDPGYTGWDTFNYQIENPLCTSPRKEAIVHIKIGEPTDPEPPQVPNCGALDDSYAVPMDMTLTVAAPGILGNDIGIVNIYQGLTRFPEHGHFESIDASGAFTYVPDPGYTGWDTFNYRIENLLCTNARREAIVHIKIGDPTDPEPPQMPNCGALDDSYVVPMDTMLTVPAPGILGNDLGITNFYRGLEDVSRFPEHGHFESIDASGAFTYIPDPGYTGWDGFMYRIVNPLCMSPKTEATVYIKVGDSPTATVVPTVTTTVEPTMTATKEPTTTVIVGPTMTATIGPTTTTTAEPTATVVPTMMTTDEPTMTATTGPSPTATAAPMTNCMVADDVYVTSMNTSVTDAAPGVFGNDMLVGTYALQHVDPAGHGQATIGSFGELEYTPDPGFVGTDSFTYQVRCDDDDQNGPRAAFAPSFLTATVYITVTHDDGTTVPTGTVAPTMPNTSVPLTPTVTGTPDRATMPPVSELPVTGAGTRDGRGSGNMIFGVAVLLVALMGVQAVGIRRKRR